MLIHCYGTCTHSNVITDCDVTMEISLKQHPILHIFNALLRSSIYMLNNIGNKIPPY